jgi:hypothetical protein
MRDSVILDEQKRNINLFELYPMPLILIFIKGQGFISENRKIR